jgi:hypothetical protein
VKNEKLMRLPFFLCILSLKLSAQISEFNKPWEDSTKAIIIEAYSENKIDWVALKTDKRVVAVIHKASQGEKADPGYSTRKAITALAPSANPKRFTDSAKTEKWFRRNCKDVLSRECTAREKADVMAWLISLK